MQSTRRKPDGLGVSAKARIISGLSVIAACGLIVCVVPKAALMRGRLMNTVKHGRVFYSHAVALSVTSLVGIFLVASGVVDYIRKR